MLLLWQNTIIFSGLVIFRQSVFLNGARSELLLYHS